jgi:exopolyphosphatase/guanosine-5'-triphosphate,3'-diphosphate pyrophosphatase
MLQPGPMQRAIEALAMFHSFCRSTDVSQIIAVGTSALREAHNQAEFLERLAQVCDLHLRILSTDEEAYYGYLGAINSLPVNDGFVFDTGGGSTQVIAFNERRPQHFFSAQAGVLRFTERYVNSDPVSRRDFKALDQGAATIFGELEWFQSQAGQRLIGLGGTVRTLARIDQKRRNYPLDRSHGYVLSLDAIEETVEKLRRSNLRERENISGLNRDRADVILAGAVIVRQLMRQSGFSELMVSGQGLREGLFYEYFIGGGSPALIDNIRGFSVQNLARIYNYEARHAAHVRKLSLSLFDQTTALHG